MWAAPVEALALVLVQDAQLPAHKRQRGTLHLLAPRYKKWPCMGLPVCCQQALMASTIHFQAGSVFAWLLESTQRLMKQSMLQVMITSRSEPGRASVSPERVQRDDVAEHDCDDPARPQQVFECVRQPQHPGANLRPNNTPFSGRVTSRPATRLSPSVLKVMAEPSKPAPSCSAREPFVSSTGHPGRPCICRLPNHACVFTDQVSVQQPM